MAVTVLPADRFNEALIANVHPADWVNPSPTGRYNLVVLGAGTAGLVAAAGAAGLGAKVALVERHLLGGDCLNVGCVPSKAILRAAHAAFDVRQAQELGIRIAESAPSDFPFIMERMRRLRAEISPNDSVARFTKLGVDVYLGQGRFDSPESLVVDDRRLEFKRAIIATGARPSLPAITGLAKANPLTNENLFELTELPARMVVIGGGPIGAEMAQAFQRLGSAVTLIDGGNNILAREEPEAATLIQRSLERDGVTILTQSKVVEVKDDSTGKRVVTRTSQGEKEILTDAILVAVGRTPNTNDLGLESAGVTFDERGVQVDDRLRTSNPRIYAAGDICSQYKFTHAADALARIAIRNALFFGRNRADELVIPWCTYTDPEIARVGLSPREAREKGIEINTFEQQFTHVDRAILDGEVEGLVRLHVRKGSDRLLGGTIVARHAGEMIGELTLALQNGVGLGRLSSVIHPYPTQAEAIKRCGDAYQRTRLTPTVASLFRRWLAFIR